MSEKLVKLPGRSAIAAFSPSGLSLYEPARRFHRVLLQKLVHGNHERLGDAVLTARAVDTASLAFPELLSPYHVFDDPAVLGIVRGQRADLLPTILGFVRKPFRAVGARRQDARRLALSASNRPRV